MGKCIIMEVHTREILDAKGMIHIEAEVYAGDFVGRASVPSVQGIGVSGQIDHVNDCLRRALIGESILEVKRIDTIMHQLHESKGLDMAGHKMAGYDIVNVSTMLVVSKAIQAVAAGVQAFQIKTQITK